MYERNIDWLPYVHAKFLDTENRFVVARGWGGGAVKGNGGQRYKLPVIKSISHRNGMYIMVSTANKTVFHVCKMLREQILKTRITRKKILLSMVTDVN